jgi:hypothetical protein
MWVNIIRHPNMDCLTQCIPRMNKFVNLLAFFPKNKVYIYIYTQELGVDAYFPLPFHRYTTQFSNKPKWVCVKMWHPPIPMDWVPFPLVKIATYHQFFPIGYPRMPYWNEFLNPGLNQWFDAGSRYHKVRGISKIWSRKKHLKFKRKNIFLATLSPIINRWKTLVP